MTQKDEIYISMFNEKMNQRILDVIKDIQKKHPDFSAEYSEDLGGFVIEFQDCNQANDNGLIRKLPKTAQTQYYRETDGLHADYGNMYLERYTEYDDKLTAKQHKAVEIFVEKFNRLFRKYDYLYTES